MLLLVTFVNDVHGMIDLWSGEARVLFHRWDVFRAEAVDNFLRVVIIEAEMVWSDTNDRTLHVSVMVQKCYTWKADHISCASHGSSRDPDR